MNAKSKKINGFTLTEVMIVVVIVGSLSALAIPKFINQMNRMKAQEAAPFMQAIYVAQKDYYRDNQSYAKNSNKLDIGFDKNSISGTLKNYDANHPDFSQAGRNINCSGGGPRGVELARMHSTFDPPIDVIVLDTGKIICSQFSNGNNTICPSVCPRYGFTECC